ncbi:ABC transporter permease [Rhizobium sp. BK376]|uniref:ABC transporter permease n=1 Tax=Rhizobium sp. BK376 TaxID=2512149 RepID=UPI0010506036|nr:ABC transporter permease [Rhizobium sp. BK376]TCR71771.1 spermidine/putrescine transport system permease protein [Rhizobium sp. BK376]
MIATNRSLALVSPAILLLIVLLALPLAIIVVISFCGRTDSGAVIWGSFDTSAYTSLVFDRDFLTDALVWNTDYLAILRRSIVLAAMTAVITFIIGFPTALWISQQPADRRNLILLLITVPFWANQLVRIYSWMILLRTGGVFDTLAHWVGLTDGSLNLLYTPFATGIGLVYSNLPYMILPIYVSLEKLDRRYIEASFDLGAGRLLTVRRILLPLSLPGIIGGFILVFVPSLGSFIAPELLGGAKTAMIANLIQDQFGELRNWPFGAALSVALLAMVFGSLAIRSLLARRLWAMS